MQGGGQRFPAQCTPGHNLFQFVSGLFFGFFWLVRYKYVEASVCSEVWRIVEIIYMEFNFSMEFVYCFAMFCLFEVITVTGMLATCSWCDEM